MLGTVGQLAARVGGRVEGDADVSIARIAAVDDADNASLTFATDARYLAAALASKAAAVLVDAAIERPAPPPKPMIVVKHARAALAALLAMLRPPRPQGPFRHPSAQIDPTAQVAVDAYIGANAVIGARARIGAGTVIDAGAVIEDDATLGELCWIHASAFVAHGCVLGNRVTLYPGAVVGSEGFGWAFIEGRLERIPQVGNVVLADDVEIGANTCVDRAQTGSTTIGTGTKIDNLVQIGHNCRIGKHCAIASLTGLAGSTTVLDYVQIAGQVGTRGHMTIGSRVVVAGQSGVWGDVEDGAKISGNPARDHREDLRREVMIRRLPKLIARVEALERDIASGRE
jgi:UDP-3-O-[3-hydroxymyristoyl] glucosamine N-acyltransferase